MASNTPIVQVAAAVIMAQLGSPMWPLPRSAWQPASEELLAFADERRSGLRWTGLLGGLRSSRGLLCAPFFRLQRPREELQASSIAQGSLATLLTTVATGCEVRPWKVRDESASTNKGWLREVERLRSRLLGRKRSSLNPTTTWLPSALDSRLALRKRRGDDKWDEVPREAVEGAAMEGAEVEAMVEVLRSRLIFDEGAAVEAVVEVLRSRLTFDGIDLSLVGRFAVHRWRSSMKPTVTPPSMSRLTSRLELRTTLVDVSLDEGQIARCDTHRSVTDLLRASMPHGTVGHELATEVFRSTGRQRAPAPVSV